MGRTEETKLALLRSAERLFAERGVDAVSLREIALMAGQRNHSAALYHFTDKRELLEQLLHRHSGAIDEGFVPAIENLRAEGRESLEELVGLLVRPLVAKLDDEDGGAEYLIICAELSISRTFPTTALRASNGPGAAELTRRLLVHMGDVPPMLVPLRMLRTATVLFGSLAAYQRLRLAGLFLPRDEFGADLEASLVAMLRAGPPR